MPETKNFPARKMTNSSFEENYPAKCGIYVLISPPLWVFHNLISARTTWLRTHCTLGVLACNRRSRHRNVCLSGPERFFSLAVSYFPPIKIQEGNDPFPEIINTLNSWSLSKAESLQFDFELSLRDYAALWIPVLETKFSGRSLLWDRKLPNDTNDSDGNRFLR